MGNVFSKMLILDPEAYNKIKQADNLSYLDTQMNNILKNKHINDTKKWYLYRQQLLKYATINRKQRNKIIHDTNNNKLNSGTQTSETVEYDQNDYDSFAEDFESDENLNFGRYYQNNSFEQKNLPSYIDTKLDWDNTDNENEFENNNDNENDSFKSVIYSPIESSTPLVNNQQNKPNLFKSLFEKNNMKHMDELGAASLPSGLPKISPNTQTLIAKELQPTTPPITNSERILRKRTAATAILPQSRVNKDQIQIKKTSIPQITSSKKENSTVKKSTPKTESHKMVTRNYLKSTSNQKGGTNFKWERLYK